VSVRIVSSYKEHNISFSCGNVPDCNRDSLIHSERLRLKLGNFSQDRIAVVRKISICLLHSVTP
jgi:hypothetical protein